MKCTYFLLALALASAVSPIEKTLELLTSLQAKIVPSLLFRWVLLER